jgi:lipoate-protein ligase A
MARDLALMCRARQTGEIVFSTYGWTTPTLSFGRNQQAKGFYDPSLLRSQGVDVVRRPTGGRALLHHREVTYSVTAPLAAVESLRESYERFNLILISGLRRLGVGAAVAQSETFPTRPTAVPCFATPAKGELTSDGRKLVGSAQWRDDGAVLQHGSILIEDDQSMIASFLTARSEAAAIPAPGTLTSALGRTPVFSEISEALFDSVRELEDRDATMLDEGEVREMALAELPRFQNERWTWRR